MIKNKVTAPPALIHRSFVKIIHKKSTFGKLHSGSEEPQCSRHVLAAVLRLILNQSGFTAISN